VAEAIHIALIDDDAAVLDSLHLYFARREIGRPRVLPLLKHSSRRSSTPRRSIASSRTCACPACPVSTSFASCAGAARLRRSS
jgi:hypothetical protein